MKNILKFSFFIALFISFPIIAQNESESITWQEGRQLKWTDYRGTPEGKAYEAARSEFEIEFRYTGKIVEDELVLQFQVSALFIPNDSWTVEAKQSNELLIHEQLHFDITELFARKMRHEFSLAHISADNGKAEIQAIYDKVMADMKRYRSLYNDETFFGANLNKQLEWNSKVRREMIELNQYVN
ncbi:MAG: hypothetical protein CMO01_14545 [Thalassobius sp.]|nr:hypothetical protein [Thalassovita sp.]